MSEGRRGEGEAARGAAPDMGRTPMTSSERHGRDAHDTQAPAHRRTWGWAHGAVAVLVLLLVASKWEARTGFTALLRFGEPWHAQRLEVLQPLPVAVAQNSGGYDGQFYAQLAVDPLLRAPELERALDAPAYRARRIFLPWVAALLGLNQPWWTLQVFALLNVAAWFAAAWLLQREIADGSARGFARWCGCMLGLGALESVRQSLVDLPALVLVLVAAALLRAGRARGAAWVWPLAVLTKETAVLATVAAEIRPSRDVGASSLRRVIMVVALALLPFALWLGFVAGRFGHWSETGLAGNFSWPAAAFVMQVAEWSSDLAHGAGSDRAVFGLIGVFGLLVQAVVVVRCWQPAAIWWRIGAAHALLLPLLGEWVWSGYWAAARALLPLTVAFNLLLPARRGFWPLWLAGNLALVHGVIRFL